MNDKDRDEFENCIFNSNIEDDCCKSPRTYEYENMERDWLLWQAALDYARREQQELLKRCRDDLSYWLPVDEPYSPHTTDKQKIFNNLKWKNACETLTALHEAGIK